MAVIQNRSTEIGDVIIIKTDAPIIGIIALTNFLDDTVNESSSKYFYKTFRYSVDGVNWSDFAELNISNIKNVIINPTNTLYLEYYYKRLGPSTSGDLEFNSVTIEGEFQNLICGQTYQQSMFATYLGSCNNLCSLAWSINVLEKLYKKGLLPKYLERGQTESYWDDQDFVDFWRAITHYFALFVCLARYFQKFYTDPILLLEYLRQKGMFICSDDTYGDLIYLMGHFYDEIRQRGTIQVVKEKGNDIGASTIKQVDGEYLRLICYDENDEFIFNLNSLQGIGWNLGNSSPLYKGLDRKLNLNKFYFDSLTGDEDLTDYPLINPNLVSIVDDGDDKVIEIDTPDPGDVAGFGATDNGGYIKISPYLSYELRFYVKVTDGSPISVGMKFFDKDNNQITGLTIASFANSVTFINATQLERDTWTYVRCILFSSQQFVNYNSTIKYKKGTYAKYSGNWYISKRSAVGIVPSNTNYWRLISNDEIASLMTTNIKVGSTLKSKSNAVKVIPYIVSDNISNISDVVRLKDISFQLLNTPYSKGFIQSPNFLEIYNSNHNLDFKSVDINLAALKYLFPYNIHLKNNFIASAISTVAASEDTGAID